MNNLQNKTINSVSWNFLSSIIKQGSNLIISIILARLLDPSYFGIIALIMIFIGTSQLIQDAGFSAAIVQKEQIKEEELSSIFWLNLFLSCFLSILLYLLTPYIVIFYKEPILSSLIPIMSISLIIISLSAVNKALLEKGLMFNKIGVTTISSAIISGCTALILAFTGWGIWALVIKNLLANLIETILFIYFAKWYPKLYFRIKDIIELLKFSLNWTGTRLLSYMSIKIDDILIGKFLNTKMLGLYSLSYNFILIPLGLVKVQFANVLFSLLSKFQDNHKQFASTYIKFSAILVLIMAPLSLGLFIISDSFVLLFLGMKWIKAIPLIKIFCIATLFQSIGFPGVLLSAKGLTGIAFKLSLFFRGLWILFMLFGLINGGIKGASYGVLIAAIVHSICMNYFALQYIQLGLWKLIKAVLPFIFISILMVLIMNILTTIISHHVSDLLLLILQIFFGFFSYLSIVFVVNPFPMETIKKYVLKNFFSNWS